MLRKSGYHNKNNIDYCAIIQNQYHKTVPRLSNHTLYTMCIFFYHSFNSRCQHITTIEIAFNYIRQKSFYIIHILFHSHILNRIIESCSIQGIDIEDEFTRGSQYKIENILLRINNHKSFNYICLNATEKQVIFPFSFYYVVILTTTYSFYSISYGTLFYVIFVPRDYSRFPIIISKYNDCI